MERMRPAIVGDIHKTSEGEISAAANRVIRPSSACDAVTSRDAAERDRSVVAPLRMPAGVPSRQDLRHRAGLDQHHDRRERGRR